MKWLEAFDSDVAKEFYVLPLQHWEYTWTRKLDDKGFWNFVSSLSYINRLSPKEKQVCPGCCELMIGDERLRREIH